MSHAQFKVHIHRKTQVIELRFKQEVKAAIDLIHENNYPDVLKDFYGELILVGISYNKKKGA